ncbi:hypothetical protein JWH04_16845 [Xanthomonas melonis]|uniref:hypothetical protein n=1 Tax=Xanthomonas melonis TaxID=56456 RepID=UPI001E64E1A7|nr:hypothetical protein [Xanthomonas melonis]MCD0280579.1 hypothetical protein [Xanthomonas melonis]
MDISLTGQVIGDATTRRTPCNASAVPNITANSACIYLFSLALLSEMRCLAHDFASAKLTLRAQRHG